ncbi:MAG TPA: J domain-containing protein, partial [Candidatus Limnocylindrales bacterium]|nr:J domain-containing protein [Candidatus Limnocylindrales bacterium]
MSEQPVDAYKVLQVDPEAEDEVIQAAYRRLAQKYHPDVATGPDAASRMAAINAAWEVLGDPAKRAAHDLGRRVAARAAERATAAGRHAGHDGHGTSHPSPRAPAP